MVFSVDYIKTALKSLIGYEATEEDDFLIELAIRDRVDFVLSYCNRNDIPPRLRTQLVKMIIGEFLYQKKALRGAESLGLEVDSLVTSITEGNTSVSFGNSGELSAEAALDKYINGLRNGSAVTLQEYRRLKW